MIGNEILSGKTRDANVQYIATRLQRRGIRLEEVRFVRDDAEAISGAVRQFSETCTCVFTTGGIGPTHDDITAQCVARAFDLDLTLHPHALRMLEAFFEKQDQTVNEARRRMAHTPDGAVLIRNDISGAPGFKIRNVYVMAGVPRIMQNMFDNLADTLPRGPAVYSETFTTRLREGDIAADLGSIQNRFPQIEIGSYPQSGGEISIVLNGTDREKLSLAAAQVFAMIQNHALRHDTAA